MVYPCGCWSPGARGSSAPTSCTARCGEHEVTVLDALTYAGSRESLDAGSRRHPPCAGRHRRCRIGDETRRRVRRRRALRRGDARRQRARRPRALPPLERHRHVHGAGGGAHARRSAAPHLDRRGLRGSRTRRGSPIHRRRRPTTRPARTRRPRPQATCWCGRGCGPTVCARRSPTAPTTMGPTSMWRSSFRARSPTC